METKEMTEKVNAIAETLQGVSLEDSFSIFSMAMTMKEGFNWISKLLPQQQNMFAPSLVKSILEVLSKSSKGKKGGGTPFDNMQ